MEPYPQLNLGSVEQTIKLPQLTHQKELPQQIDDLAVLLKPTDLESLPDFLQFVNENSFMQDDLKKKKHIFVYGRSEDKFKRCWIRVSTFNDHVSTLTDAGVFTRNLLNNNLTAIPIYFSSSVTSEQIATFVQGVCLTNYKFDRKGEKSSAFNKINSITLYHAELDLNDEQTRNLINIAQYPLFCREVLNARAFEANPTTMLELCKEVAKIDPKVKIETIVGKELQEKGLNLIHAVGKGGAHPPCLVVMKYEGNSEKSDDLVCFIGKGVCFDAGGLNIKGTGNIETMYMDKGGACTVLAAFKGIVETKMPVNVVVGMAYVENLLGPDAVHPLDIVKSYKGLTVEIGNTDAEGRLILADAMSYVQLNYKPHTLIEFSTLTGAVSSAIGRSMAGLFTNSEKFSKELSKIGKKIGEPFWSLPLLPENRTNMKGTHGDLNNKSKNPAPGASNAAAFLEFFVEKGVTWAHLDIAGVKSTDAEKYVYSIGATGFGVQFIFSYLKNRKLPSEKPSENTETEKSEEKIE